MGYKNNQFYNLPTEENAIRQGDVPVRTNKGFDTQRGVKGYPDNRIRTYRRDGNKLIHDTVTLKRGYIRSLQNISQTGPTTLVARPVNRCDFQFNPSTLQQSVSMRTDVLNVFLQDPIQLTQPLASQTQFGFSLMFDRTFTYNNESDETINPNDAGLYDIANIGVLHDIRLLYAIIGQGISEDLITAAVESARNTAIVEARESGTSDTSNTSTDGAVADIGLGIPDNFDSLANSYFSANLGNSGFLIPLPVRVVFSSLYMIDGYVTNSSIVFTKFSTSYVPIQCMVNISMQAMYIGFAKEQTFLSQNLEDARRQIEATIQNNKQTLADFSKIVASFSPKIETSLVIRNAPEARTGDRGSKKVSVDRRIASLVTGETEKTTRKIKLKIVDNTEGNLEELVSLFESTSSGMSVTLNTFVEVYELSSSVDRNEFLELTRSNRKPPDGVTHAATLSSILTISTSEELKNLFSTGTSKDSSYYIHKSYSSSFIVDFYNDSSVDFFILYRNSIAIKVLNETFTYEFDQVEDSGTLSKEISDKPRQSRPKR
jgi:hypothetical protein